MNRLATVRYLVDKFVHCCIDTVKSNMNSAKCSSRISIYFKHFQKELNSLVYEDDVKGHFSAKQSQQDTLLVR